MATRQGILGGQPGPIFIDESALRQGILPGIYLDDTVGINAEMAETANAVDAPDALGIKQPVIAETAHAVDAPTILDPAINLIVSTRRNAVDTSSITVVFARTVTETMHATDVEIPGINLSVTEAMSASDRATEATNGTIRLAIVETLHAVDTITVQNIFHLAVTERTKNPITSQTAMVDGTVNLSIHERGGGMVTTQRATIKALLTDAETLHATDHVTASLTAGVWNLFVQEFGAVRDRPVDPETFASPGIHFWGYQYFFEAGFTTVAVWCGGLDCGDHAVADDGSVFVPWQSDPDQLFTPAFLINLSNNPPRGGFGASAVNIDLTTNTGMIRITVDLAIGLPYKSRLQLLRPNTVDATHSQYGPSLAETRRLHMYGAQLANAQSLSIGTDEDNLRPMVFTNPRGDKYPMSQLFTGVHWDLIDDEYDFDGMMLLEVLRPYPAAVSALSGFVRTYDRE